MKLATRLNSVLPTVDNNILKALEKVAEVDGITSVDLNYPEHFSNASIKEVKEKVQELGLEVNGVALRFRKKFINGEFGNKDSNISDEAYELCCQAADACTELNGKVITLWFGFDGFDYPFQVDYNRAWEQMRQYITRFADYAQNLQISIEYKPYQERSFALIDSIGTTMLMVNEVNRPNVGVTVDYCHMLMKRENPAYGLTLAAERGKLFGVHLNDGYGDHDDGLMVGSVTFMQTLEFMYYIKKYNFTNAIYFDTFPIREEPIEEVQQNVRIIYALSRVVDSLGLEFIENVISKNDAVAVNEILLKCLNNFVLSDARV